MPVLKKIHLYRPPFQKLHDLMPHRIGSILFVSNLYDYFILEEDGQLNDQLMTEYINMNFRFGIPQVTHAQTGAEALKKLETKRFDLVILMTHLSDAKSMNFGQKVKETYPDLPVVMLIQNYAEMDSFRKTVNLKGIDNVFFWSGDSAIFLAIIKLIEDKLNVDHDLKKGNVRVIIVVEDSFRYYSLFLPIMYNEMFQHTRSLVRDDANEQEKLLRLRTRPKILLANNYEEAIALYAKYKSNLLGIISDIRFPRQGKMDPRAGIRLIKEIKQDEEHLAALLHSSDPANREDAQKINAHFLYKHSRDMLSDLRRFILSNFGFGDFVFRLPNGSEVDHAHNLREMINKLHTIQEDSLIYHSIHNHFSHWLFAHGEFELAEKLRPFQIDDFESVQAMRLHMISLISETQLKKQRSGIVSFNRQQFDPQNRFIKIGNGSIGGKARSIAFLTALFARHISRNIYENVEVFIPLTTVIATDLFDLFIKDNNLGHFALESADDQQITRAFINAPLPDQLNEDLRLFLHRVRHPIAVRSSSLLEDSRFQPFAGIYHTHMLPNNDPDIEVRLNQLSMAIKMVYASTFSANAKAYLEGTSFRVDEEKMAVVLQEMIGKTHDSYFYPDFSGVAQSFNFYPIAPVSPKDGMAFVALGLGKMIVDGGRALRFSPKFPENLPQFSTPKDMFNNSQREFFALPMNHWNEEEFIASLETLVQLDLSVAETHGVLDTLGSVYSAENHRIVDSLDIPGPRLVTFARILKYKMMPLAELLTDLLTIGKISFGGPVEIEFAVNLARTPDEKHRLGLLQIRPMINQAEGLKHDLETIRSGDIFCYSKQALGNGRFSTIHDLVYVRPESFTHMKTEAIAGEIEAFNRELLNEDRPYILAGPGRWGSSDHYLGIPVNWSQISGIKILVETRFEDFNIDPSQGTHFFQNLTSLGIGYLFIDPAQPNDLMDWEFLNAQKAHRESHYLRWLRFDQPISVLIDGRKSIGAIFKPGKRNPESSER